MATRRRKPTAQELMVFVKGTCSACKHWLRDESPTQEQQCYGECRRYPPTVLYDASEQDILCLYPTTAEGEHCGEFAPYN